VAHAKSLAIDSDGNLIVLANTVVSLFLPTIPNGSSDVKELSVGREEGDLRTYLNLSAGSNDNWKILISSTTPAFVFCILGAVGW
jgi:hypothetical protein